jgi:hypothetical protein
VVQNPRDALKRRKLVRRNNALRVGQRGQQRGLADRWERDERDSCIAIFNDLELLARAVATLLGSVEKLAA